MTSSWNNAIWCAIDELKFLFNENYFCIHLGIDEIFLACEERLYSLGASEREARIRLFALALYCSKTYPAAFWETAARARFALDSWHFHKLAKTLIKENNHAFVVFWAVLRCSLANSLSSDIYLDLEQEMRDKALEASQSIAAAPRAFGSEKGAKKMCPPPHTLIV
ncbi:MAG: hypothetical protein LBC85_04665 [Fibromonadaceae bacterium]|jgi:hypothetical protein|nr:hypothetical protein [Fibromonadaceae bacterium]